MGKKTSREPMADQGAFAFEDDADFESTSTLMTNRSRFEALPPTARARLAEALVAAPIALMVEAVDLESAFQKFLSDALDAAESVRVRGTCAICHNPYEEGDEKMEQRVDWYTADGKKFYGEPTGEDGHARCVKHLRDGGDAETKPLF